MEETPPIIQEQALQCLAPERHEVTGESSDRAFPAQHWEAAEEPPQDHASDQEDTEDEENLSEVNQRADRLEFIREFQEIMNKQLNNCLTSQGEVILTKKINLNHAQNRESVRKPYARKQKCFHQEMSAENLMMNKTV